MLKFSRFCGLVLALWCSSGTAFAMAAVPTKEAVPFVPLENEFATAIVMTPKTHQILYAFKPETPRVAASLSKLANALAFVTTKPKWDRVVSLLKKDEVGGGRLRVASGAKMTVRDVLFSSVVGSANNAAMALARLSGFSMKTFLAKMNSEAKKAGATHSVFFDPSGMDSRNMTTAKDMALIAEKAFSSDPIGRAASTAIYRFTVRNTGQKKVIQNTNSLLTQDPDVYVVGGKTGYLEESMYNVAVEMRPYAADGTSVPKQELVIVVLGAPTKEGSFSAAKRLAQWAWNNHEF